jgi:hypothetical protein
LDEQVDFIKVAVENRAGHKIVLMARARWMAILWRSSQTMPGL